MIELNLQAAPAINKYDWEVLSCFERTLATISYTLHGEAFWNFVLCKYSACDNLRRCIDVKIGDPKYYDIICEKAGISLTFNKLSENEAFDFIIRTLREGAYPIFVINDKKRPMSKHYKIKDHGFFVLIYGYDEKTDEFLTYDLPLEREYWRMENSANGIEYLKQRLSREVLFSYSDPDFEFYFGGLEKNIAYCSGNYASCFVVTPQVQSSDISGADLLKSELITIIADEEFHKNHVNQLLAQFNADFDTRYDQFPNIRLEDITKIEEKDTEGVKHLLFYPYEWQMICWHEAHIKMLKNTLPFLGLDVPDSVTVLHKKHQIVRLELIKNIIKHDKVGLNKTAQKAMELLDEGIVCYKQFVDLLK